MKALLIILALCIGSFCSATADLPSLFNAWKLQHNKIYPDIETEAFRFEAFCSNYDFITKWNAEGNSAVMGLTKFSDLTVEEFSAIYNGLADVPDSDEITNYIPADDEGSYPSEWDWREHGVVTDIKNQGDCGSCWSFGSTVGVEGLYALNGNPLTSFSEGQLVDCLELANGCDGGFPAVAIDYIAKNGQETLQDYPYTPKKEKCQYNKTLAVDTGVVDTGYVTPRSADALYQRAYIQPTTICVAAGSQMWQNYISGVIGANCSVEIDHVVAVVGYTSDYFIVKNSWGTDWGMNGYVYISSDDSINAGLGACAIFAIPQFPTGLKNQTSV